MMDRGDWERAAAIYVPLMAAVVLRILVGRRPKQFAACLLGILWAAPSLVVLQALNMRFGWWSFSAGSAVVLKGMPLELWVGWVLLWGVVPQFGLGWVEGVSRGLKPRLLGVRDVRAEARTYLRGNGSGVHRRLMRGEEQTYLRGNGSGDWGRLTRGEGQAYIGDTGGGVWARFLRGEEQTYLRGNGSGSLRLVAVAAFFVGLDCLGMPLMKASVQLGPWWLVGEAVAVGLVLLPALMLGDWTRRGVRVKSRAGMQVAIAAGLFLYLVPEVIFAARPGVGWVGGEIWWELAFCLAVPGLSAVMEFAGRGGGTPIPYDPPLRLVTTGVYRYVANPMQLSCALVMVLWACMLRSGWMAVAAGISVVYSAGIAAWDEGDDLRGRFGEAWVLYRRTVRDWWPRWRPYCAGDDAVVYMARGCEPCSAVRRWLEARQPAGLRIMDAEVLPQGSIRRMRYVGADGVREDGVRAFARALEHVHLGWCWLGMAMRLPGVWWGLQVVMDACGLGEREVCAVGMVRK